MTASIGTGPAGPTVTVRPITREDYAGWLQLWTGYNAFYGRAGATALPDDVTAVTWQRFFDPYEPMHALVACGRDGALLGLVHYLFHRSTTMIQPNCYLQDLFTAEAARGLGVGGRALLPECRRDLMRHARRGRDRLRARKPRAAGG